MTLIPADSIRDQEHDARAKQLHCTQMQHDQFSTTFQRRLQSPVSEAWHRNTSAVESSPVIFEQRKSSSRQLQGDGSQRIAEQPPDRVPPAKNSSASVPSSSHGPGPDQNGPSYDSRGPLNRGSRSRERHHKPRKGKTEKQSGNHGMKPLLHQTPAGRTKRRKELAGAGSKPVQGRRAQHHTASRASPAFTAINVSMPSRAAREGIVRYSPGLSLDDDQLEDEIENSQAYMASMGV